MDDIRVTHNWARNRRVKGYVQGVLCGLLCAAPLAMAVYTPMPWEGPICMVASSLKGQVAVVLSVVATIMIGIMFMYAETGAWWRALPVGCWACPVRSPWSVSLRPCSLGW